MATARKLLALLTPEQRRGAVALLGLMVAAMVLETFGLGLILPMIALLMDSNVGQTYPQLQPLLDALGNPSQSQLVGGGMMVLVTIYLVKALFLAFVVARQTRFAFDLQAHVSQRLFDIYLHQPYTFHLHRNSAKLIRNASTDASLFTFTCTLPGLTIVAEGMVLIGIASLLLVVEPLGTLIVLLVLGGCAWAFQRSTSTRIARWGDARQHHEGLGLQHLQQGLGGAKEVKVFGREDHFTAQYRLHSRQVAYAAQMQQTFLALPRLWLEPLAVVGLAILVLTMMAQGYAMDSTVRTVGLFAAAAFRLTPATNRILNSLQSLIYGSPIINTLHEEFSLARPEIVSTSADSGPFRTQIQLSNVSYTYPVEQAAALDGLSIVITRGEFVGFIGPSGSGKTTLVDIILGLLSPSTGRVLVDGRDIHEDLRAWQEKIGYVPQAIYLIDDTLRRNVAFGLSDEQIDEDAVVRAIRAAQLDDFAASLPAGLNTVVGERGVRLSGGERQRIGIARALYHDPDVLVLDEATSSLDTATEHDVMQAVSVLRGSKTVIIVAHRLSTVEGCDRLYRLVQGKVFEEGSPDIMLFPHAPATGRNR